MTNSPPTRDVSTRAPLTGDEKIMHEIKRLRFEMEKCMKQIRDIQVTARKGVTLMYTFNSLWPN